MLWNRCNIKMFISECFLQWVHPNYVERKLWLTSLQVLISQPKLRLFCHTEFSETVVWKATSESRRPEWEAPCIKRFRKRLQTGPFPVWTSVDYPETSSWISRLPGNLPKWEVCFYAQVFPHVQNTLILVESS